MRRVKLARRRGLAGLGGIGLTGGLALALALSAPAAPQQRLAVTVCYQASTSGIVTTNVGPVCAPAPFPVDDCVYPSTGFSPYIAVSAEACVPF
ncbi:MAG: hypothetical protein ACYCO3_09325 [Mycobacteriales bacterium]